MNLNEKYTVNPEFEDLLSFENKENQTEHNAKMLMFKFLSEIENLSNDEKLKKKDLAAALGTSASYITQLFRGDKLINLLTLAKLQDVYNIDFDVKARSRKTPSIVYRASNKNEVDRPLIDNSSFINRIYSADPRAATSSKNISKLVAQNL